MGVWILDFLYYFITVEYSIVLFLFYKGTLSIMFNNTECIFKANLFFLANTQNPDQV